MLREGDVGVALLSLCLARPRDFRLKQLIVSRNSQGVTAFITLSEDWELAVPIEEVEHAGFAVLALPTPDYQAPTQAEIRQAVDFLIRQTAQ